MRSMFSIFVGSCLALVGCLMSTPAKAAEPVVVTKQLSIAGKQREYFFFVADGFREGRLEVGSQIEKLIEKSVKDVVIHLFATPAHEPIATVVIGDEEAGMRMRSPTIGRQLKGVRSFIRGPPKDGSLEIDMPRVPNSIATVRRTPFPAIVVLCGDPVYTGREVHRGFSFERGSVGTDMLLFDSPMSHLSPYYFGVKKFPDHTAINILAHSSEWGVSHHHRSEIERFYRLFAQEKGNAHLLKITANVDSAFNFNLPEMPERVKPRKGEFGVRPATLQSVQEYSSKEPLVVFLGRSRDKPPMFQIDPPTNIGEMFEKAMRSKTHTLIAIRWNIDSAHWTYTDLDLHLSHPKFPKEVAYDNRRMPFARLLKDVRYGVTFAGSDDDPAKAFGENWEMVVVPNEYLKDITAYIDVFSAVGPINVNVAQVGNGVRKDAYYTIPNRFGDEAQDSKHRDDSRAWFPLQIPVVPNQELVPLKAAVRKVRKPAVKVSTRAYEPLWLTALTGAIDDAPKVLGLVNGAISQTSEWFGKLPKPAKTSVISPPVKVLPVAVTAQRSVVVNKSSPVVKSKSVSQVTRYRAIPAKTVHAQKRLQPVPVECCPEPVPWDYLCCPAHEHYELHPR